MIEIFRIFIMPSVRRVGISPIHAFAIVAASPLLAGALALGMAALPR